MLHLDSTSNTEAALLSLAPASNGADTASFTPATAVHHDKSSSASPRDVQAAASRLGFAIPEAHAEDYLQLLQATDRAAAALLDEPGKSLALQ